MRRRAFLAAAAGMLAGSAGAGEPALLPLPLDRLRPIGPPRQVSGLAMAATDGASVDLAQYRGRLVVLNLWASWCFPCREEMPSLSRLAAAADPAAIAVLPLAIERRGAAAVARFYRETGIANLPTLLGDGPNIAAVFGQWGLPFTVLIDADGREFGRVTGAARWDDVAFRDWLTTRAES